MILIKYIVLFDIKFQSFSKSTLNLLIIYNELFPL